MAGAAIVMLPEFDALKLAWLATMGGLNGPVLDWLMTTDVAGEDAEAAGAGPGSAGRGYNQARRAMTADTAATTPAKILPLRSCARKSAVRFIMVCKLW